MLLNGRKLSQEGDREGLILLAIEDITDKRKAEQYRRWLASVVASSSDAIVSKDLNGIVTSWNKGAEKLFGYTAEEMVGRPIATLIPRDRLNEEPMILKRIARAKLSMNMKQRVSAKWEPGLGFIIGIAGHKWGRQDRRCL